MAVRTAKVVSSKSDCDSNFPASLQDANSELLALVSEVAADFAVWPTQRDEVLQRATRIIGRSGRETDSVRDRLTEQMGLAKLVWYRPRLS